MADNKSIATRDSYGAALLELADAGHDDIVVFDADLSASTRTSVFAKKYSERFFDCGIAECNMVGVAAGMSTFGYVPFVSSFAMFAAGRAFEQIRNSIGYPELNVKIAATHGGRHLRGRGRCFPPVLRGLCADAHHPRHGRDLPL